MGPCQGRICGPVVAAIAADVLGKPIAEIGTWRPRTPVKPITVDALSNLEGPNLGISEGAAGYAEMDRQE
jgi:Sarcosine oxidase A3 domain